MIDKEMAEEYAKGLCKTCTENVKCREWRNRRAGFYCGVEFGYNKANEWHYVKDRLSKEK